LSTVERKALFFLESCKRSS